MGERTITIDVGESENAVLTLETDASAVELLGLAMRLGYLAVPEGTMRRRGDRETRSRTDAYAPASRIVEIT